MPRRLLVALGLSLPLPAMAANCVVTSGANGGAGTLRNCLGSTGSGDTITFSVATVTLTAGLPLFPAGVTVDGAGTVTLDGTGAALANGLRPIDDCTVTGMRIEGFAGGAGILADGDDITLTDNVIVDTGDGGILANTGSGYTISGNTIGEVGQPGVLSFGIGLFQVDGASVTDNVVVGVEQTVSGDGNGIELNQSINVEIRGNHVGVLADGVTAFGNENIGIVLEVSSGTGNLVIDNVVSDNDGDGILVADGSDAVQLIDNRVGTDSAGMVAIGNGGDGIRISASDDAVIERNVIADNSGSGIKLVNAISGDYQSGQQIRGNRIGLATDGWTPMGNAEHGVVSFGQGGGHVVERNVIGSNGKHGIWIDDVGGDPIVVRRNSVGTDMSRSQLLGNGSAASGPWNGIHVTAQGDVAIGELDGGNYVANTATGHGIFVSLAQGIEVRGNTVVANAGDGIRSRGGSLIGIGSEDAGNIVWSNGLSGIVVVATSASGPSDINVLGNQVGDANPARGNADDGIRVEWATGDAAFSDILVQSNAVRSNGDVGIRLKGSGLDDVEMHRNILTNNGLCPVLLQNGANSGAGAATAPSGLVVAANEEGATGTWAGTGNLVSVEVYSDSADELAYFHGVGAAGVAAGTWTFWLDPGDDYRPIEELAQGRVSVMITVDDAGIRRTSAVTNLAGDGCSGTSCNDFNPCTTDTFGGGTCSYANVTDGIACQSGDPWTTDTCQSGVCTQGASSEVGALCDGETVSDVVALIDADVLHPACSDGETDNECTADQCDPVGGVCDHEPNTYFCEPDGNPCTADDTCDSATGCTYENRPNTFVCDDGDLCNTDYGHCDGAGACDAASNTTGAPFLPYATACSDAQCVDGTPVYLPICDDGYCGPDDFGWCRECIDPGQTVDPTDDDDDDDDNDGFPDVWEDNGFDADCDGTDDFASVFFTGGSSTPDVFVYLDWMVAGTGDSGTSHEPVPGAVTDVFDAFDRQGFVAQLDVAGGGIVHYEVLGFGATPSSVNSDDWVPFYAIKNGSTELGITAGFDPLNRAIYHYAIWGHQFDEWNTNRSGFAEVCGNDFMVTAWAGGFTGSDAEQAGTLIHELGHNLCLHHGGIDDSPNYEPIYPSSMNYRFQGSGLNTAGGGATGLPDYSTIQLANLNEAAGMAELTSFASATAEPLSTLAYRVNWDCPVASGVSGMAADPTPAEKDWNCIGGIAGSPMVDINGDGSLNTNTGFDDWDFLANSTAVPLRFHENVANYADGAGQVTSAGSEMSDEVAIARGFLLVVVEPVAGLLPGCSDQSSSAGRRIPLVVYGTTTFDATAIQSAWTASWNGAAPTAGFVDDVDNDGEDDWIGHYPADDVVLGAGTSAFAAQLATSQRVLAQPAVSFAAVADTDGDGLDDNCDACPATLGTDAYGCP